MGRGRLHRLPGALGGPLLFALVCAAWAPSRQATAPEDLTVRGCVERDAASRVEIFRLVVIPGNHIYRLTAPKAIDVGAQVGHFVEVTGTLSAAAGGQNRDQDLTVKTLTSLRDSCTSPGSR